MPRPLHATPRLAALALALVLTAALSGTASADPDLIGYWPCDEGSGPIAADSLGVADATLGGGAAWDPAGRLGAAVGLDGDGGRLDLGAPDYTAALDQALTVSLWVRPDAFPIADARLVSRAAGTAEQDHVWMVSTIDDTGLRFRLKTGGVTHTLASDPGLLVAGEWSHVAAVYDGAEMRLYHDGELVAALPASGTISADAAVPLAFGNQPAGAGERALAGALDEIRLFGRALSGAEVGDLAFPGGNYPPVPVADVTPLEGPAPLEVTFDGSASYDVDGAVDRITWAFGVADSVHAPVAVRTFADPGQHTATLVVEDDGGAVATEPVTVVVTDDSGVTIPFTHEVIDADPPAYTHAKGAGDIDGDGLKDIFVAGARDGDGFFWYRNPTWTRTTIVPAGVTGYSTDMAVTDVDGDGDLDAVIPKGYDHGDDVYWYENPRPGGDPAVDPWTEHHVGVAPAHDVETGDVDGDGRPDVVVRWQDTTLFLQVAPDTWSPVILSTSPDEGLDLADLDGDGDLDAVLDGSWLENPAPQGDPAVDPWPQRTIVAGWTTRARVHVADIDGDGGLDVILAAAESTGERVSWFGTDDPLAGPWTEHEVTPVLDYVHSLEAADLDLDGDLDLVAAEMHQSVDPDLVVVFLNEGGGESWVMQEVATTGSHNMVVTDMDADGDADLVGANHALPPVEMWINGTNPAAELRLDLWQRHVLDAAMPWQPIFLEPVRIDGDPLVDLVAGGWWFANPGSADGAWVRNDLGLPLRNMAAVHDFDGDGDADVLGTQAQGYDPSDAFAWAQNDGSGGFTVRTNVETADGTFLQGSAVAPLEDDGLLQVVLAWQAGDDTQTLTVPADPAADTWTWQVISGDTQGEGLAIGDIDGDGDLDLLQGTQWLRNESDGSWTTFLLWPASDDEPDRVHLVDMNGDGRLDSVVGYGHDRPDHSLSWYEQPADPTELWIEHPVAHPHNPQSVDVADLDLDGDLDLVAGEHNRRDTSASRLLVYENLQGTALAWREIVLHTGDEHHVGTRLFDADLDGDLDIASIGYTHPRLMLYENLALTGGVTSAPGAADGPPPARTQLAAPSPNPFNPSTRIRYTLPRATEVELAIYDVRGRRVAVLVEGLQEAGSHEVQFAPRGLASGVYLAHLRAGGEVRTTRMLLLK